MTVLAARARPVPALSPAGFAPAASTKSTVAGREVEPNKGRPASNPAALSLSASVDRSPLRHQHTKGQRTPATGSALALDKKGA